MTKILFAGSAACFGLAGVEGLRYLEDEDALAGFGLWFCFVMGCWVLYNALTCRRLDRERRER